MPGLKLSDLKSGDVQPVNTGSLRLSDLHPEDVQKFDAEPEVQQPPNWSKLESVGQGALQGATAGFSDELGGALGALQEKVLPGGNPDKKSMADLYREYRDFHRARNKEAHEANPISNDVGSVAGGILPAIGTGGSLPAAVGLGATTGLGTSDHDLTTGSPEALKGASKDTLIGGGLGLAGGLLAKGAGKLFDPNNLEVGASKMASKAVGIKPSTELTSEFNAETGKVAKGSDIIKGLGHTAMEEGALPAMGGSEAIYDNTLKAIDNNQNKLVPIMQKAQAKLDQNLAPAMKSVGSIDDKIGNWLEPYLQDMPYNSKQPEIAKKLQETAVHYSDQLLQADGNLPALNAIKKELQNSSTELAKNVFTNPDVGYEADMLKRMSGIVRQHIEDLANAADPGLGDQIGQTNKTLSNLYTYLPYTKKLMDKPNMTVGAQDIGAAAAGFAVGGPAGALAAEGGKLAVEGITGNPIKRLGQIGLAHAMNSASKAIDTPIGSIVQKAIPAASESTVSSPWAQNVFNTRVSDSEKQHPTQVAGSLYNATDDSLKEIASKLSQQPNLKFYGEHLNKAIDTNDQNEKNRAIFLILQNPASRKQVTAGQEK